MPAQSSGESAVTREDVVLRDELIAAQETLLNTYRCRFFVDTEVVRGGCVVGVPRSGPVQPAVFDGVPDRSDVAVRDELIAAQEALLNTYRCRFDIDTQVVAGGCTGFWERQSGERVSHLLLDGANELRDGLAPLALDANLSAAAQRKAQAQADADDWQHDFDFVPLLSGWAIWFEGQSARVGAGPRARELDVRLSGLLVGSTGAATLRCEICTHLGVGVASRSGRTFATFVVGGHAPAEARIADAEAEMAALVNQLRVGLGLDRLVYHDGVAAVARRWSQTMAAKREIRHNPSYSDQYPSGWRLASENVASIFQFSSLSDAVHQSFDNLVDSPGHYANMVNPDYTHVGAGIAVGSGGFYVTQNFARYPATPPATPDPQPNSSATSVELAQTDADAVLDGRCTFSCTWQQVTLSGFPLGTYTVECWSLDSADGTAFRYHLSDQYTVTVGDDGTGVNSRVCWNGWYDDVAENSANVYVTVNGIKSNTTTLRRPGS